MERHAAVLTLGLVLFPVPLLATEGDDACVECPNVDLVREDRVVHVFAEDDRDDARDLAHRIRVVTGNATSAWTDWDESTAYELQAEIDGFLEAQSRDLDGNIGTGIIELTVPEPTEPIGPGAVQEDSSREARWDDDALGVASSVVDPDEPPPVNRVEYSEFGETPTHDPCEPAACTIARVITGEPARGHLAALALLGFLLYRRRQ